MNLLYWWRARLPRERAVVGGGLFILIVVVAYLFFEPVVDERRRMVEAVPALRDDLIWMQAHVDEIVRLQKRSEPTGAGNAQVLTPAVIEEMLRQAGLKNTVSELRSDTTSSVSVAFDEVVFADLMVFFRQLNRRKNTRIRQAVIRRLPEQPGEVEASFVVATEKHE